ncbi:unnamed protein product [Absidia cylindrospora]
MPVDSSVIQWFCIWNGKLDTFEITGGGTTIVHGGITVWFSDVDIVFTSDTIYDYLANEIGCARKSIKEMLFTQETEQRILNSGFYIMRPHIDPANVSWRDSTIIQENELKVTQQRAINRIIDDMDLN